MRDRKIVAIAPMLCFGAFLVLGSAGAAGATPPLREGLHIARFGASKSSINLSACREGNVGTGSVGAYFVCHLSQMEVSYAFGQTVGLYGIVMKTDGTSNCQALLLRSVQAWGWGSEPENQGVYDQRRWSDGDVVATYSPKVEQGGLSCVVALVDQARLSVDGRSN
jgi:hypothetical protein